jgi:hypothetical protein
MSEQVRQLVGLENVLVKARRRFRECERESPGEKHPFADRYREVIERLVDEFQRADTSRLTEYLEYLESDLLPRMSDRADELREGMVASALQIVDARHAMLDLRAEYSDALDRIRAVRERLGKDPFKPHDMKFGLGTHPPHADRRVREAFTLVKEYLKS